MVDEVAPRVVLGGHLGQRTDREATGESVALVEHGGDVFGVGEEREAVLGERCGRPQLAAGLDRLTGAVADAEQARPVVCAAAVVDHPDEPVEVAAVDQAIEIGVARVIVDHATQCVTSVPRVSAGRRRPNRRGPVTSTGASGASAART